MCFDAWLQSAAQNAEFDFLLITDLLDSYVLPENIHLLAWDFTQLKEYIQRKFPFSICLERPYKLCDYKPAYGYIFQEYLADYEFWGHCDLDLVFGSISTFWTKELLDAYDRIGTYGHAILYRNTEQINYLFMQKGAAFSYQKIYQSNYNYNFDERFGLNQICRKQNVRWHDCGHRMILDKYRTEPMWFSGIDNYLCQRVLWQEGRIYRVAIDKNGRFIKEEKMYFHFSKMHYSNIPLNQAVVFDADICCAAGEGEICDYLNRQCVAVKAPKIGHDKWTGFWQRTNYQKYIYLRQQLSHVLNGCIWRVRRYS